MRAVVLNQFCKSFLGVAVFRTETIDGIAGIFSQEVLDIAGINTCDVCIVGLEIGSGLFVGNRKLRQTYTLCDIDSDRPVICPMLVYTILPLSLQGNSAEKDF